ncbi:g2748 [Coccomyxa elongata]
MSDGVEAFFRDCPGETSDVKDIVQNFIDRQRNISGKLLRPIVCVTSGGTTVPLEQHCVRFIDNFSGGTRGALSAEQFLQTGYAVIFLHRRHSIQPFTKGLPSGQILDFLTDVLEPDAAPLHGVHVTESASELVSDCVSRAKEAAARGVLLRISFESLFEYLQCLRVIAAGLRPCGRLAAFYLAAAVSDFYIPWSQMVEHKIQSADLGDGLTLKLQKVPKMLGTLRTQWAPDAFLVSFKLETDEKILISKASKSIARYGVHAVVANILEKRKEVVHLVRPAAPSTGACKPADASTEACHAGTAAPGVQVDEILRGSETFIEAPLVLRIVQLHEQYQQGSD